MERRRWTEDTARLLLAMPASLLERIRAAARAESLSASEWVRRAVEAALER